ncbi:hypothetical protein Tco_1038859 [Tanacetum coccineum]
MEEVAAMSESAFHKRFRSSYESLPSLSPPDLTSWKRYRGTSKLVEDSEEDDEKEIEESLDSDSLSKDTEDECLTAEDEDPTTEDQGLAAGVEGPGRDNESYGLDDESHGMDDEGCGLDDEGHGVESDGLGLEKDVVPRGQQQAASVMGTTVSTPLWLRYGALRRQELVLKEDHPTLTSWTDPEDGMVYIDVPAYPLPAPLEGLIHDHAIRLDELSPALFERSLEYEQERVTVTFGAIWRPVLALESWASQTDSQRAAL